MKYCEKCDGEGIIIDSTTTEDDLSPCEACAGMGVTGVPQFIFLQIEPNLDEVTWCPDSVYDNDLEYQLVDLQWKKEWPDEPGYWWSWKPGEDKVYIAVWGPGLLNCGQGKPDRYYAKAITPNPPRASQE